MLNQIVTTTLAPTALYLDASAVSIVVVSIAGIATAVGATITILFRKAKKKAAQVLHIDENANKEVESDIELKKVDDDDDEE